MVGVAWAAIALLATALGFLIVALFGLRGEFRGQIAELRAESGDLRGEMRDGFAEIRAESAGLRGEMRDGFAELRSELREAFAELRSEMREVFRTQGERIDALAARMDVHIDRHAS